MLEYSLVSHGWAVWFHTESAERVWFPKRHSVSVHVYLYCMARNEGEKVNI